MTHTAYCYLRSAHVDRSPMRSLVVFFQVIGRWWLLTWVISILGGLISLAFTIARVAEVPPGFWGFLLALGVFIAPAVAFHFLRIERDEFNSLWGDKERVMQVLTQMEALRSEAAPLQIRGMRLDTMRSVNKWINEVDAWTARTRDTVALLHPAEAGNFKTLGVFKVTLAAGTKPFNAAHRSAIQNLVRRMQILGEIRDRWAA